MIERQQFSSLSIGCALIVVRLDHIGSAEGGLYRTEAVLESSNLLRMIKCRQIACENAYGAGSAHGQMQEFRHHSTADKRVCRHRSQAFCPRCICDHTYHRNSSLRGPATPESQLRRVTRNNNDSFTAVLKCLAKQLLVAFP